MNTDSSSPQRTGRIHYSTALILGCLTAIILLIGMNTIEQFSSNNKILLKNGELIGGDFFAFYLGGKIYEKDRKKLYDLKYQQLQTREELQEVASSLKGDLPFVYPPLVAAFFSCFSDFELHKAFLLWTGLSFLLVALPLCLLSRNLAYRRLSEFTFLGIALIGYIPFSIDTLLGGQLSSIGVAILSLCAYMLFSRRPFLAGLILSLGYYKPPLFLFMSIFLLTRVRYTFAFGAAVGALILTSLTILSVGTDGLIQYLSTVSQYRYGQELLDGITLPPSAGMGLYALLTSTFSNITVTNITYGGLFIALILLPGRIPEEKRKLMYAYAATCSVGLSLQCIRYDLALLLPAFLIVARLDSDLSFWGRRILRIATIGFYLEFLLRGIKIVGTSYNFSAILFIVMILTLLVELRKPVRRHKEDANDSN